MWTDMRFQTFDAEDEQFGLDARGDSGGGAANCRILEEDTLGLEANVAN